MEFSQELQQHLSESRNKEEWFRQYRQAQGIPSSATLQSLFDRALNLIEDAAEAGVVINLAMPTASQQAAFNTQASVTAAQNGPVKVESPDPRTLYHPQPTTTGCVYG